MKLESRRERAERLKKQRRSTLAGMIIAIIVVVALGVVLWRGKAGLEEKNADYQAQSYNPRLMTRIKEVMNCLNMRSMSRQRSSLRRLPRINSGLYILTNWCLSLITSKIHTKYYVGAGRFFESFMLRHFIYKQSYILHIGVVPERKWI